MVPGRKEVRTSGTVTAELLRLSDWLQEEGVTTVAMESTGVYWKPVFNVLETTGLEFAGCERRYISGGAQAQDRRQRRGMDSVDLLRHGLVRASFIPSRPQRDTARAGPLSQDCCRAALALPVQRIQKLLEGANIKLSDVASDIVSLGTAMLRAWRMVNLDLDQPVELDRRSQRRSSSGCALLKPYLHALMPFLASVSATLSRSWSKSAPT